MNNKNPLLSICIPTYNRAEILEKTLSSISSDPDFDDEVEIVISDNCSSDKTQMVCKSFTCKYYNIKYYRNEYNVKDKNFYLVMSRATGKYLKILNDTCCFKSGMLRYMKSMIKIHGEDKVLLFPSFSYFIKKESTFEANDKNRVLHYLSYNATWTPTFGMWHSDFGDICKDSDFSSQLAQVVWIYKMVEKKSAILCFNNYFDVHFTSAKGNYNYMHVFVDNYLGILKRLGFKKWYYEHEKIRLLFMLSSFFYFMKYSKTISYSSDNAFKIMYREYWYEPYFYFLFPLYLFLRFFYEHFIKPNK